MQIRVLGHVEASLDDRPLTLGGAKQRAVLAMLGLEADRAVSADRLIEGLWGEDPPPSAAKMVQNYVWRLRRAGGDGGAEIVTRGRAYELRRSTASRWTPAGSSGSSRRRRAGRATATRPAPALALFRGDPLADIADEPFAIAEIRRLEELRLTAAELAIDADLAAGRHQELVGEIDALLAENPLRERLHAQRMLALYRCGRQAEALEAYRQARDTLVEEIGIEPGRSCGACTRRSCARTRRSTSSPPRAELPRELDAVGAAAADRPRATSSALRAGSGRDGGLVALAGAYGMGKTRLAAELAAEVHRDGAHGALRGRDRPGRGRAGGDRAHARGRRPALLVVDDADRAPVEVRRARCASSPRAGARARHRPAGRRAGAAGAARVARARAARRRGRARDRRASTRPPGSEIPVDALLAASRGVAAPRPRGGERVGAARGHARVDARGRTAPPPAAARRGRSRPSWPAASSSCRSTRERARAAGRRSAPVTCPYKGLATLRRRRRRVLLRARAARRRAGRAPRRRAAARGRRPVGQRQVLGRAGRAAARARGRRAARQRQLDAGGDPPRRAPAARAAARDPPARPRAARRAGRRPVRGAVHRLPGRGRARASSSPRSCAPPTPTSSCSPCAPTSTAAAPPTRSCRACSAPTTCSSAR